MPGRSVAAAGEPALAALPWRLAAPPGRTDTKATGAASRKLEPLASWLRQPGPARLAATTARSLLMWAAIPLAWIWIAGRVYDGTDSLVAGGGVALLGLALTEALAAKALNRIDRVWVSLRRRAGHEQAQGALTRVVVVSATLGLLAFMVWYYVLSSAFIIPFMPSQ